MSVIESVSIILSSTCIFPKNVLNIFRKAEIEQTTCFRVILFYRICYTFLLLLLKGTNQKLEFFHCLTKHFVILIFVIVLKI